MSRNQRKKRRASQGISLPDAGRLLKIPNQAVLHQVVQQEISHSSWSGPIPPPAALREFNEIIPDGANRILSMAERQSAHRISLESANLRGDISRSYLGTWFAFIIVITSIGAGAVVAIYGDPQYGAAIAAVPSVGMVGVFIYGKISQKRERESRLQAMLEAVTGKRKK